MTTLKQFLLICLLCGGASHLLNGQDSDLFVAPLPEGEYVADELILHFPEPVGHKDVEEYLDLPDGQTVNITSLDSENSYFLVHFNNGLFKNKDVPCKSNSKDVVNCQMCQVIGNPGDDDGVDPDGIWPNYLIGAGANAAPLFDENLCFPTSPSTYDPFAACQSIPGLPNVRPGRRVEEVVDIAILDTGIDPTGYEDYFSATFPTYDRFHNIVQEDPQGIVEWHAVTAADESGEQEFIGIDDSYHGTAVAMASIALQHQAGRKEGIKLHSYRVLNQDENGRLVGTVANLMKALDKAINQEVEVINMSLGFKGLECDLAQSMLLSRYFVRALREEILIFVSAGNDGNDIAEKPQWPAAINLKNVYTIGANRCANESTWSYSNVGDDLVDILAPGQDILLPFRLLQPREGGQGCFALLSGTSFATPLVASLASVYRSYGDYDGTICRLESRPIKGQRHGLDDSRLGTVRGYESEQCDQTEVDPEETDPYETDTDDYERPFNSTNGSSSSNAFPNPFDQALTISVQDADLEDTVLSLLNNSGRVIMQIRPSTLKTLISTNSLSKGVYFLRTTTAHSSSVQKLIKK